MKFVDKARRAAAQLLIGNELAQLEIMREAFDRFVHWKPLHANNIVQDLIGELGNLGEDADDRMLDLLRRYSVKYEMLGYEGGINEKDRLFAIKESRHLYNNDPLTEAAINTYVDFGSGVTLVVTPVDTRANEIWQEFMKSPLNRRYVDDFSEQAYSTTVLTDGEYFNVFFTSRFTGETTIRTLLSDEIQEIITHPEDEGLVLYYVRKKPESGKVIWYPDWLATDEQLKSIPLPSEVIRADDDGIHANTDVVCQHVAHKRRSIKGLRGWPLGHTGFAWSRAYRDFLQDRAAIAKMVASTVDKVVVKSGSRGVDAMKQKFQSSLTASGYGYERNPAPVAGSYWLENENVTRTRLPMNTAAGDAKADSFSLGTQAALGMGNIPIMYLGRPDQAQNRAVALVVSKPFYKSLQRYRNFRTATWLDTATIVLEQYKKYNNDASFDNMDIDISTDRLVDITITDIVQAANALERMLRAGLPSDVLVRASYELMMMTFEALGVGDAKNSLNFDDVEDILDSIAAVPEVPGVPGIEPADGEPEALPDSDEPTSTEPPEGWPQEFGESHKPEIIHRSCPLCGHAEAKSYPNHSGLLVCAGCEKTYDPSIE